MAKQVCTLGVDIGASAIKMVEAQVGGGGTVTAYQAIRTELPDPVLAGEMLSGLMATYKFRAKRCVTAVSGRGVIVRPVALPDLPPAEFKQAARAEAEKFVPYDIGEAMIDCHRLSGGGEGRGRALVVVARRQAVEDQLLPFGAANLAPAVIDIDGFALANALVAAGSAAPDRSVALVDLGHSKCTIAIVRGEDLFVREIYRAGAALDDAIAAFLHIASGEATRLKMYPGERLPEVKEAVLPTLEEIAGELRQVFDQYTGLFKQSVSSLLFSGGVSKLPGVVELFGRMLETPAALFNPFAVCGGGAAAQAVGSEVDFAVAFGLAVRP